MHPLTLLRRVGVVAAALLAAACSPTAQNDARTDVRIERLDKSFDLDAAIKRVAIDNPWGEINVRSGDEREVGVHAVIQHLPPKFANFSAPSSLMPSFTRSSVVETLPSPSQKLSVSL